MPYCEDPKTRDVLVYNSPFTWHFQRYMPWDETVGQVKELLLRTLALNCEPEEMQLYHKRIKAPDEAKRRELPCNIIEKRTCRFRLIFGCRIKRKKSPSTRQSAP